MWRLTRGSDRLRSGFYYFCGENTPFYPGIHHLGSRDWTSDERDPPPVLGEYDGERKWVRGDPPSRIPLPVLVGTPDCIEHGEDPGLARINDVDANCGQILPSLCYAQRDAIKAKTDPYDCVFAKATADIINAAYTDLPAAAALATAYMPAGTAVSTFPQPTILIPAGVVATIGDTTVLWLTGTTNFAQLAVQGLYLGFGPINQGAYSTATINELAAMTIAKIINDAGLGNQARFVLTGHSYGGAIAIVLAAKMRAANPNRNVSILTLGAPQCGDQRLHDLIEDMPQRHYANQNDPIPFLPPRRAFAAGLRPIVGAFLTAVWSTYVRPPQTKMIQEDGEFIDARADDLPDDLAYLAVLAIVAGLDVPKFKDHRTDWYSYYLCLGCKCVARPCVKPDGALLGFDFILEGLRWFDGTVVHTENFAANLTYEPLSNSWSVSDGIDNKVFITVTLDGAGNYDTFTVFYYVGELGVIHQRFEWHFPAAEMVLGIDTTANPELHSLNPFDVFLNMGRLVIPSSFGFPPVDGDGDGGFDPIMDGDGP